MRFIRITAWILALIPANSGLGQSEPEPPSYKISVACRDQSPSDILLIEEGKLLPKKFTATEKEPNKAMDDLKAFLAADRKARTDQKRPIPEIEFRFAEATGFRHVIRMLDDAKNAGYTEVKASAIKKRPAEK